MFQSLIEFIKTHDWLLAGLGISGFGLISFWLKDVPLKFLSFLKRHLTTDLILTNYDEVFYELLNYIQIHNKHRNFRTFKLNNGKWGTARDFSLTLGYGRHLIWYKHRVLFIDYTKEKESIAQRTKEYLTIIKLGRTKKLFQDLIADLEESKKKKKDKIPFYKMDDGWCYIRDIQKRPFKSMFLEKEKKDLILNTINTFLEKEKWYLESGIPYQLGILLYGQPGTGKTSFIKCLASYLNYSIYYLSPSKLSAIEKGLSTIAEKSIIVIEDIDTNSVVSNRKKIKPKIQDDIDSLESFSFMNLSDVLNSLDGLANVHGRILIGTTNHLERLDKALIRPGRFDLLVELSYTNKEVLKQFFDYHYSNEKINYNSFKLKNNITVADLQKMLLQNLSAKEIIKLISI